MNEQRRNKKSRYTFKIVSFSLHYKTIDCFWLIWFFLNTSATAAPTTCDESDSFSSLSLLLAFSRIFLTSFNWIFFMRMKKWFFYLWMNFKLNLHANDLNGWWWMIIAMIVRKLEEMMLKWRYVEEYFVFHIHTNFQLSVSILFLFFQWNYFFNLLLQANEINP